MRRFRNAKIIATLGPSSSDEATIRALFDAGADVFRLNFSHGTHADHQARLALVRAISRQVQRPIAVIADLQGPKLRIGTFGTGHVVLTPGTRFCFDNNPQPGDASRVHFPHPDLFAVLVPGTEVLLDDGRLRLRVQEQTSDTLSLEVVVGGTLKDRKGVNVPNAALPLSALTPKDKDDLRFALDQGVDWIALSFVQRPEDLHEARALIQKRAGLMAKFEKPQAIAQMDVLIALSDAVMVARGDLGVEMPAEDVPAVQKQLIRSCRRLGTPVIVATQMLESMVHAPTPTRAEASDVATAVYDGADAVMLSAESASGDFPVEAVAMMDRIIRRVEQDPFHRAKTDHDRCAPAPTTPNAITAAARQITQELCIPVIVTLTTSGFTTLSAARERPRSSILCITPHGDVAQRMSLVWGVHAVHDPEMHSLDAMATTAARTAQNQGFANIGDEIVVTAGIPFHTPGTTNVLRIVRVGTDTTTTSPDGKRA